MRPSLLLLLLSTAFSCQHERPPEPPSTSASPPSAPTVVIAAPTPSVSPKESVAPAPALSVYEAPKTKPKDKDGWLNYLDPPSYDAQSVSGVFPGTASPEAAVVHYLASRVRGDKRYRETLSASCDRRCASKLEDHDQWTFLAFRLVGKKEYAPGKLWVKVWFQIEYEGRREDGEDDFEVLEEAGAYRILYVPT